MPEMKAVGMNTDRSTSTSPMTGPWSSFMALMAAWRGVICPLSTIRAQSSTTTMASSTTMAMASTRPKSVRVLRVNPISFMTAKVAMSETGIVSIGMMTALQLWRKNMMTIITMSVVSTKVTSTSSMEAVTKSVEFMITRYFTPSGKYCWRSSSLSLTFEATSRALAPGVWLMPSRPA